jgi:hypothetical protein
MFQRYGLRTMYLGYGGGGHSVKFYYKKEEFKTNVASPETLQKLCYVHGSLEELLNGKVCVVRCGLRTYTEEILSEDLVINEGDKDEFIMVKGTPVYKYSDTQLKSIKTECGKTLIYIGVTQNGNYKVILKP